MSWRILVLAVGMLLASSAAIGVFAGPGDTSSDGPPAVAGEPDDGTDDGTDDGDVDDGDADDDADDGDADEGADDGQPDEVGALQDGHGQREVLGIPEWNAHPCDSTGGCDDSVPHPSGKTMRLPGTAAAHRGEAPGHADADGDDDNGGHGPPDDVPRGGPHADDD